MARIQVSTSRDNQNTSVAGFGKGNGFNREVHGTNAGTGVTGTDGSGESDGFFEVLDAVPAWYLRDQAIAERSIRVPNIATPIALNLNGTGATADSYDSDTGIHSNLTVYIENNQAFIISSSDFNDARLVSDSTAQANIEVGDSIKTVAGDAEGVIINLYDVALRKHFDVQITRGSGGFTTVDSVVLISKGALVSAADSNEVLNFAQGTLRGNELIQVIPS